MSAETEGKLIVQKLFDTQQIDLYKDDTAGQQLNCTDLKKLYKWKHGKNPTGLKKPELIIAWNNTKNAPALNFKDISWTTRDNETLHELKSKEITIDDTELGRRTQELACNSIAGLANMSAADMQKYLSHDALETLKSIL